MKSGIRIQRLHMAFTLMQVFFYYYFFMKVPAGEHHGYPRVRPAVPSLPLHGGQDGQDRAEAGAHMHHRIYIWSVCVIRWTGLERRWEHIRTVSMYGQCVPCTLFLCFVIRKNNFLLLYFLHCFWAFHTRQFWCGM